MPGVTFGGTSAGGQDRARRLVGAHRPRRYLQSPAGWATIGLALTLVALADGDQRIFRGSANLVLVDVVVTDANGRPVGNLTADQFEIVDRGRRQAILEFTPISVGNEQTTAHRESVPGRSGVYSNTPGSTRLRDLVQRLVPGDDVALVFSSRSDLAVNVTRDHARVLAGIERASEAFGFGMDALGRTAGGGGSKLDYSRSTVQVLQNVATALDGDAYLRKTILFVSAGSPLDPNADLASRELSEALTAQDYLRDAFELARRANARIYTIDPRGQVLPETAVRGSAGPRYEVVRRIRIQHDYLATIAINTGGRAFLNQSDLQSAVDAVVAETSVYYLLGYRPDPAPAPGDYRSIQVRVRPEGLRVSARHGYALGTAPDPASAAAMISSTLARGLVSSAIRVEAAVVPVRMRESDSSVVVSVTPGTGDPADKLSGMLAVHLAAVDANGRIRASSAREYKLPAPSENRSPVRLTLHDALDVPQAVRTLRLVVGDPDGMRVGSVDVAWPLEPSSSDDRVWLGGLAIGAPLEGEANAGSPAVRGLMPFPPTTRRTFADSESIRLYLPLSAKNDSPELVAAINVDGTTVARRVIALHRSTESGQYSGAVDVTLPMTGLVAGRHLVSISVHQDPDIAVTRDVEIEVR